MLVQHQLDEPKSLGLDKHELYHACRAKLYVSSEAALDGHLAEFTDHHLVRTRRSAGKECYYCTLSPDMMKRIVADSR